MPPSKMIAFPFFQMIQTMMIVSEAKPLRRRGGAAAVLSNHQEKKVASPSGGTRGSHHQDRTSCQVILETQLARIWCKVSSSWEHKLQRGLL